MSETWKACGSCKKPIEYGSKHYICSVSTCNTARFSPVFCSFNCWDAHVPVMNHRSAWAEDRTAPDPPQENMSLPSGGGDSEELRARLMRQMALQAQGPESKDVLVVASKLKRYIKDRAGMNCSADVLDALSDYVRYQCNDAIDRARNDGRKTVKGKDFSSR